MCTFALRKFTFFYVRADGKLPLGFGFALRHDVLSVLAVGKDFPVLFFTLAEIIPTRASVLFS